MDHNEFERAWNEARDLDEVVTRTGYNRRYAARLAARMRADGHDMRAFKRGPARKEGPGIEHKPGAKVEGAYVPSESLSLQFARTKVELIDVRARLDRIAALLAVEKTEYEERRKVDTGAVIAAGLAQGGKLVVR